MASSKAKGRRLSRSSEFQRAYRQGKSRANRFLVLYTFEHGSVRDAPRLGISVGRKVGNAVVRNRLKRTIRAAFEELAGELPPGLDYVVLARRDLVELVERDGATGVRSSLAELIAEGGGASPAADAEPAAEPAEQ